MNRKGTNYERIIAICVGLIIQGIVFVVANAWYGGVVSANLYWLLSIACGLGASLVTAVAIVKFRR